MKKIMHLHSSMSIHFSKQNKNKTQRTHLIFFPSLKPVLIKLILKHHYGTRANIQRKMEKIRGDIDELKGEMEKMMEMLHALDTKENPHMRTMISEITGPSFELQHPPRINTTRPEFGFPPNYSPPFVDASVVGLSNQHVVQLPAIPEMQPPHVLHTMAPRPLDDPRYAYHNLGSYYNSPDCFQDYQLTPQTNMGLFSMFIPHSYAF